MCNRYGYQNIKFSTPNGLLRWCRLWLYLLVSLLLCPAINAAEPGKGGASAKYVVEKLYKDYAWTLLFEDLNSSTNLLGQSKKELSKYFSNTLSNLFRADYINCKNNEICNVDFDLIYDSQDTDGTHQLRVYPMDANQVVRVTFLVGYSSPSTTEIRYKMIYTLKGWRIENIYYSNGLNILDLLKNTKN
jgi:hypothetical protein